MEFHIFAITKIHQIFEKLRLQSSKIHQKSSKFYKWTAYLSSGHIRYNERYHGPHIILPNSQIFVASPYNANGIRLQQYDEYKHQKHNQTEQLWT